MAQITREQAWLNSTTPNSLLRTLKGKRLPRQRRLFAVACCRRVLGEMADELSRRAVEVAESFADGLAGREELNTAYQAAQAVAMHRVQRCQETLETEQAAAWALWRLAYAAQCACAPSQPDEASDQILKRAAHLSTERANREKKAHSDLIRDIFGNPFRPVTIDPAWLEWNDGTVAKLAQAIYDERAFERLPVLADALEDAGCADADFLTHCRGPGEHARGCWVVDLLLGKE
jgi:hypothetical protein